MTTTKQLLIDNLIRVSGDVAMLRAKVGELHKLHVAERDIKARDEIIAGLKSSVQALSKRNNEMEYALRTLAADAIFGMRKLKINSKERLALSASINAAEALAGIPF